jgi:hypothetical protein
VGTKSISKGDIMKTTNKLVKRNVLLKDKETKQWLNNRLEIYPVHLEEGIVSGENLQGLEVVHTEFKSKLNALIAYLRGGEEAEFNGLRFAVRLNTNKYILIHTKTMGSNSLMELLTHDWKGRIGTVIKYGKEVKDYEKLLSNPKFVKHLEDRLKGLDQYLKTIEVSFSKEFDIPKNWKGEVFENKVLDLPSKVVQKLGKCEYDYIVPDPENI